MYVAIFKGSGKRIKYANYRRPMVLYGMKFFPNKKILLTEGFVTEAGLDNDATREAVKLSLKTDFGILIIKTGGAISKSKSKPTSKRKTKTKAKPVIHDDIDLGEGDAGTT